MRPIRQLMIYDNETKQWKPECQNWATAKEHYRYSQANLLSSRGRCLVFGAWELDSDGLTEPRILFAEFRGQSRYVANVGAIHGVILLPLGPWSTESFAATRGTCRKRRGQASDRSCDVRSGIESDKQVSAQFQPDWTFTITNLAEANQWYT